jgi:sulfide:quinone oxidoreductase
MKRILILGGGTAGTLLANKLVRTLDGKEWCVTVVDKDEVHVYQPGLLFIPFGTYRAEEIVRPRVRHLDHRVELKVADIARIAPEENAVTLGSGELLRYDLLVVATGSRILPEATPGLTGVGWRETAHEFYTLEGALALRDALDWFRGGRVVINVVELPIKCPVAPLEIAFLLEAHFRKLGVRDKVQMTYATPLEGAFTKPRASEALGGMMAARGIEVVGDFSLASVDGARKVMTAYDGRELPYDLLVTVPLHGGAEVVAKSGLADASGWVLTDKRSLQSTLFQNVFALGDATDLPSSKAGSVAHFQGEVVFDNIIRWIGGRPLEPAFDGHANCFIETGDGKAMLIDFNYTTEPLPGRFPLPGLGPFTLLEESAVNHWGKLGFKWVYWNMLLEGKELPVDHRMVLAGKWS